MARISGVNIPTEKAVYISLQYVYGIGDYISKKICEDLKINPTVKVRDLQADEVIRIREYIDMNITVEGDLRRNKSQDIVCYRGLRHRLRLPCRGQRTHTNSRTRRKVS
jgi:small subunit ribosomal protein S13